MIIRLFLWFVFVTSCCKANADIVFSNLTPGNFGTGFLGAERLGTVVNFTNPGTYDLTSIDTKILFTVGTHQNVSAVVTLYSSPDMNDANNIFQNFAAQGTFQLGNVTATNLTRFQTFNFDFAALNITPRFTDNMGIDISIFENGAVSSNLGFGVVSTGAAISKTFYDDDGNGFFASSERGLLSQSLDTQLRVNGFSISAVPEPSSLTLCTALGLVHLLRRRRYVR